jgi:hypothetical protein
LETVKVNWVKLDKQMQLPNKNSTNPNPTSIF